VAAPSYRMERHACTAAAAARLRGAYSSSGRPDRTGLIAPPGSHASGLENTRRGRRRPVRKLAPRNIFGFHAMATPAGCPEGKRSLAGATDNMECQALNKSHRSQYRGTAQDAAVAHAGTAPVTEDCGGMARNLHSNAPIHAYIPGGVRPGYVRFSSTVEHSWPQWRGRGFDSREFHGLPGWFSLVPPQCRVRVERWLLFPNVSTCSALLPK
jgi:hypothetical protein